MSTIDTRRYRRKSDGTVYRVVVQARSLTGPVTLRAVEGPGEIETTNDRLAVDYEFFRYGEPAALYTDAPGDLLCATSGIIEHAPQVPPAQVAFFDAHMEAMDLALRAEEAQRKGERHAAFRLYRDAVVKEADALARVPADRTRTLDIIGRSVSALTRKAADAALWSADAARESAQ